MKGKVHNGSNKGPLVQEVTALIEGPDEGIGVSSILLECPSVTYIW